MIKKIFNLIKRAKENWYITGMKVVFVVVRSVVGLGFVILWFILQKIG
jgi:hypothetical protein